MKIRKLQNKKNIKTNEYAINGGNKKLYAIQLNIDKIYTCTLYMCFKGFQEQVQKGILNTSTNSFINFCCQKVNLLGKILDENIQYVLDSFAMIFCTTNDTFETTKRKFYNIGYDMEDLIIYLISLNVSKELTNTYLETEIKESGEK